MNQFETFLQLHTTEKPLLLGNCWDVSSAKLLEENGFKAIGTSSLAIAQSLGYEDGENMPFNLLLETVKRIKQNITVPLSVDIERGYSNTIGGVFENIQKLHDIGIVGINIEDSVKEKTLQPIAAFAKTISAIADYCSKKYINLFINARTDAFLLKLPNALKETIQRNAAYESAGASGIFVPFIKDENDISVVVASTTLPINVLPTPGLPGIATLGQLGIRRISLGSSLYNALKKEAINKIQLIQQQQSFDSLF